MMDALLIFVAIWLIVMGLTPIKAHQQWWASRHSSSNGQVQKLIDAMLGAAITAIPMTIGVTILWTLFNGGE